MDIREHAEFRRPRTGGQPLAGQQALVTGANSGIGQAVAFALADAGAAVVVNYVVGEDEAQAIVDCITAAGGRAIALRADASSEEQVETMFEQAIAAFGTLDIVVANAGLQRDAPFEELTLAQWNTVIDVNLTGQFLCAREAVREFRGVDPDRGDSRALGKIICMSSVHEVIPWAGHAQLRRLEGRGHDADEDDRPGAGAAERHPRQRPRAGRRRTPINTAAWSTRRRTTR